MSEAQDTRYTSFTAFFPYYMSEHQNAVCRVLHFVGTSAFLSAVVLCLVARPLWFGVAICAIIALGVTFFAVEAKRSAVWVLLGMIAAGIVGHPGILGGIIGAYAFAWIGHFKIEHNRPATFTYPLWSLTGDLVMWSHMLRGRGWSGDGRDVTAAWTAPR